MSLTSLDTAWYLAIKHLARATPALHGFLAGYALWAGPVLLALVMIGAWWRARHHDAAAVATVAVTGLGTVIALLACQDLLSEVIARPRPCATLPGAKVLLSCSPDFSMPSDHAAIAGGIAAGLWLVHRGFALVATALGLLLAFARVYAGVHYPGDVILGMALAAAITLLVVVLLRRPATQVVTALAGTSLASLVTTTTGASAGPRSGRYAHDARTRPERRPAPAWDRT